MITKDMLIGEALEKGDVDKLAEVLAGYGMHCLRCMLAHGETIEQSAAAHDVDADELVNALNAVL